MKEHLLDEFTAEKQAAMRRRRSLLPVWMKLFIWLFMTVGILSVPIFVVGCLGSHFLVALYGLETDEPSSFAGFFLTALFAFKGLVSFFLWFEKRPAITLGIIDACIGILICIGVMFGFGFFLPYRVSASFRLEIVFLIVYLIKLINIREKWKFGSVGKGRAL